MDAMLVKRSSELSSSSSSETVDGEMAEMVKWFAEEGLPPLPVAPSEPKPARDMRHFFKPVAKAPSRCQHRQLHCRSMLSAFGRMQQIQQRRWIMRRNKQKKSGA